MTLWVKHTKAERIALLQRAEEKFHINQLALEGLLGCWRTGHGDHRPTLRERAFYLENWLFNHWLQCISALLCLLLGIERKRIESVLGANYYSTS